MDKEIFEKYISNNMPFNGETLYMKNEVSLAELRDMLINVIEILNDKKLMNDEIYKVWDWLQHDGVLLNKERVLFGFLNELLFDTETLYEKASADTYVRLGIFDDSSKWYMRIYVIEDSDLEDGEERVGSFDITLCDEKAIKSLNTLCLKNENELIQINPKKYFERIRV